MPVVKANGYGLGAVADQGSPWRRARNSVATVWGLNSVKQASS